MSNMSDEQIKEAVRERYGDLARKQSPPSRASNCCGPLQGTGCCQPALASNCCGPADINAGSSATLYPAEQIADLPDSVTDISLGCGNPTAIADLKPGQVVLDLGSGGGIDCFLAAKKVGPQGRVIGLDMTPDMIKLAQRNAKKMGAWNVEFRLGEMEDMPLPDSSVDVIISNCVINLSPDKDAVFREAFRVLRPGGWMAVSDIVLHGELPPAVRDQVDVWASCVAGALQEAQYLEKLRAAGFDGTEVLSRDFVQISELPEWENLRHLVEGSGVDLTRADRMVASVKVRAHKPA